MEIRGKVALVSGAGSGIGRATAMALAREGAKVVVADIDDAAGEESVELIRSAGGDAVYVHADVSREDEVRERLDAAEHSYGGLHILHNNAGILEVGPRFPRTPPERFMKVIDINLRGVLLATYHAIPLIQRSGGGVIVQTASSAAITPHRLHPVYAASKAGVLNFSRWLTHLHEECGIRVNCVCPGLVRTNLSAHAAEAMPEDERAAFLALRAGMLDREHLTPEAVAAAVLTLVRDESLNGAAYLLQAGEEPRLV
jgi:NAD(P)-dependent dehydrogenase (short-subunit alcohol dehydrogenase family)